MYTNYTSDNGTLMQHAVVSGSLAMVEWLQTVGLDARALSGRHGVLPLHCACEFNHSHMAEYLLALPGAADDIHARSTVGHTPLHKAAQHGADSVIQSLLHKGADVNARDYNDGTPMMVAKSLSVATAKLLLAAGADVTAVNNNGCSVLHYQARSAACAGAICLLLNAGADPTAVNSAGNTPARVAGLSGNSAIEALLSRAADDYRKQSPAANGTASDNSSGNSNSSASSDSVTSTVG
jgi:ankyrin repeat protein